MLIKYEEFTIRIFETDYYPEEQRFSSDVFCDDFYCGWLSGEGTTFSECLTMTFSNINTEIKEVGAIPFLLPVKLNFDVPFPIPPEDYCHGDYMPF